MTDRASSKTPSRLAKAVRLERDRKGWTSERLAEAAGVSHSWVRNFEAGIIQNPGADRLQALEQALDLRVGELYAASLNVPYDKLVQDLLAGQDGRKAPWDQMLAQLLEMGDQMKDGQVVILREIRALARRISPSASRLDEGAVEELVANAAERGVQAGLERAALHPAADEASS